MRLGFLRDHAIDFAVVVNINHAYLDIRHKCVQGGDEMRAPLFRKSGDDVNGAFLFGDDCGEDSRTVVKIYTHLRVFIFCAFVQIFKHCGIGAESVPLVEHAENFERHSVLLRYQRPGTDQLFAFALRSYTDENAVFAFHLADVLS